MKSICFNNISLTHKSLSLYFEIKYERSLKNDRRKEDFNGTHFNGNSTSNNLQINKSSLNNQISNPLLK